MTGDPAHRSRRRSADEGAADRAQAGAARAGAGAVAVAPARRPRPARSSWSRRPAGAAGDRTGCGCARASPASAAATWPRSTATPAPYFDPIVSFPFMPGHEVVGRLERRRGARRVVLDPGAALRDPRHRPARAPALRRRRHQPLRAARLRARRARPADRVLQRAPAAAGATACVAHPLQLVDVPDDLSDEDAVMVEPTACARARAARLHTGGDVAIIGAGTRRPAHAGAAIAAARDRRGRHRSIVAARYPHQRRLATALGADRRAQPGELARLVAQPLVARSSPATSSPAAWPRCSTASAPAPRSQQALRSSPPAAWSCSSACRPT